MTQNYILPNFDEASSSQIPAILQLINMGYTYIPRHEVDNLRDGKNQYILRDIQGNCLTPTESSETAMSPLSQIERRDRQMPCT